ncbi:MAG: DUF6949 family protein [Alphaproteobacteria bacterium]
MIEMLGIMLAIAMGFCVGGLVASAHILVTDERIKFEGLARPSLLPRMVTLFLLLLTGPVVLIRNSVRAAVRGLRPRYWLFFSTIVASGWSFCLGLVIFNLLVMLNVS